MRLLLYLVVIGVAVYLLIALIQRRRSGGAAGRRGPVRPGPGPGPRPRRPVAPDDDPAFLAELDRRRREAERRRKKGDAGAEAAPGPSTKDDVTPPGDSDGGTVAPGGPDEPPDADGHDRRGPR